MLLNMIGQIKVSIDRFGCVFVVAKVFSESVAYSAPCFADVKLFAKSASYTIDDSTSANVIYCYYGNQLSHENDGNLFTNDWTVL